MTKRQRKFVVVVVVCRNGKAHTLLIGMQISIATIENSMESF